MWPTGPTAIGYRWAPAVDQVEQRTPPDSAAAGPTSRSHVLVL
ncbi:MULTISPECIES: hypothetical protein [Streptomyces]|nr:MULTISPECIES: hypothetical protein [Streptomyces]